MRNSKKQNLLIISHDKIGSQMAGPGIRYHYMAQVLSATFNVTIGFFDPTYLPDDTFERSYSIKHIDAPTFENSFGDFDVIIALWLNSTMLHFCNVNNIFVVMDMYSPVPVENLAAKIFSGKNIPASADYEFERSHAMYKQFFENCDLFLVSNKRQLDYWTGYVFGTGIITPSTYRKRQIYDRLIYAPMGIDSSIEVAKEKGRSVMKGRMPEVKKDDLVLLWTGGIYDWFDGETLVRAMKLLQKKMPRLKLVFFGTKHPNPSIPEMNESLKTRLLAKELGLIGRNIVFQDGWVNYHERLAYLNEADAAIYTHKPSIETEFSHRTRALDHILAELPTIATEGDYFADEVIKNELGRVCPANDPQKLAEAIQVVFEPKEYKRLQTNIRRVRQDYDWSNTLRPLSEFLATRPDKLVRINILPKPRYNSRLARVIKKSLPVPVKRVIVSAIKKVKNNQ